jgi:CHAT domain-containing protein/tetratricopeptide (TPR) repeat protein
MPVASRVSLLLLASSLSLSSAVFSPVQSSATGLNAKFFGVFLAIEGQRSEYRLQPAVLGIQTRPAKAGTLNAVLEGNKKSKNLVSRALNASQSSAETEARTLVEKYFALYAAKDLDGLMSLWSAKIPDPAGKRKALGSQVETSDVSVSGLTISRVKIEGERASLRCVLDISTTNKPNRQTATERQTSNFNLVREEGMWKLWEITPAVNDLAAALERAASEQEQEQLLAQEKDMVNSSLVAALRELASPRIQKRDYAQALITSQLAARIAERVGDRTGLGNALCDLGLIYYVQNRYTQALDYSKKAFAIGDETGDKKGIARALYVIGITHRTQGDPDRALESLNASLAISQEIGDKNLTARILNNIGMVYKFRRDYELALESYNKSRELCDELNDKIDLKSVLNSIGNVHQAQGRFELALEFYRKSRDLCEELNDNVALAVTLNNIGAVYELQGRNREALAHFLMAVKIHEEMGTAADKRIMASTLERIGWVYTHQGRDDLALEYYRKSLKIQEDIKNKYEISSLWLYIGSVYESRGLYEETLEWFQKALKLKQEMSDTEGAATCLKNIGDIYRQQGRYDLALENLQMSLRLEEETGDRRGVCKSLSTLSLLYQDQGHYTEMLEVSRRAAKLAEEIHDPESFRNAQGNMGRALLALGRPEQARQNFLAAIGAIESMRQEVAGGELQRQSFLENRLDPWLGMIELLVSQKDYAEALSFAEQSKARVLLDALQSGRASLHKSLSPQERQIEEEQRLRLVALNSQLTGEEQRDKPDPSRMAELKAGVEKARLEYEAVETALYATHHDLKTHRGEASIIKSEELKTLLPDATGALLEYVVADDRTYLFAITKAAGRAEAELQVYTIPIKRAELAKQTESFRAQLAGRDLGFRASAHKLYDLLLKPAQGLLSGKSSLVIAPDNKLWELPFQALLDGDGRYVIEKSAVSYVPSLTVLREMQAQRGKRQPSVRAEIPGYPLLALGNPAIGKETIERSALTLRDEKLDPLPEAEKEVKALGQLYGGARSKVYIGAEAREDRLKAEAAQARVLHFATHGVLDNAAPMYSHLVLAQGDKNEDGLLEAWELMQLDLKADLAVLSACETARGRFGAGEGVIGLTWALFIAGVPSTVVSQWKVESNSTRELMLGFHRSLRAMSRNPAPKAEALRQAALKVMKNPETSHPFYWAGFVLVGADR